MSISGWVVYLFSIISYSFLYFKCAFTFILFFLIQSISFLFFFPFIHPSLFNPFCGFIFTSFSLSHTQYLIFSLNPSSYIISPLIHSGSPLPPLLFLYILLLLYYTHSLLPKCPPPPTSPSRFCLVLRITHQWNM